MEATWVNKDNEAVPGLSMNKFLRMVIKKQPKYKEKDLQSVFGQDTSQLPTVRLEPATDVLDDLEYSSEED